MTRRVGDPPLPAVVLLMDLPAIFGVSYTTVRRWEHAGDLVRFEVAGPRLGKKIQYSGKKIQAAIDGDVAVGAGGGRRFFGGGAGR